MLALNIYIDPTSSEDVSEGPDIPLIIPTDELARWIEMTIDPRDLTTWLRRAWPGPGLKKIAWPTGFPISRPIQINRLIWPATASRWAYMSGLIDAGNLTTLQGIAYGDDGFGFNPLALKMSSMDPDLLAYEEVNTRMFLLPPIPLSNVMIASDPTNPFLPNQDQVNNLYLIQLVDDRFFWWSLSTQEIATRGKSWVDLFRAIANIIDTDIDVDPIPPEYLSVGQGMIDAYEVIPPYLDAVAANVGQRIAVTIRDNLILSQNFENAKTDRLEDDDNWPDRTTRAGDRWYKDTLLL